MREVALEGEAHGLAFDIGDKEGTHRLSGAASALVGSRSIVIHDASTLGPLPMPLLLDTDCEDLERVLAVNLVGPFRLTKALAGPMIVCGRGLFVFLSSDAAVQAYARWGSYGISKAAQDHLARSLAAELDLVRFVAIDPGEMNTRMHADAMPDADPATLASPAIVAERIVAMVERAGSFSNGARISGGAPCARGRRPVGSPVHETDTTPLRAPEGPCFHGSLRTDDGASGGRAPPRARARRRLPRVG